MAYSVPTPMNPWEDAALNYTETTYKDTTVVAEDELAPASTTQSRYQGRDSLIYPGLYSASGFDIMGILLSVLSRPNPQIELGPIDCSVALTLCDLTRPDQPIVYVSDAFSELTGYSKTEVIGHNCRFLQTPPPGCRVTTTRAADRHARSSRADKTALRNMHQAVYSCAEVQVQITNYRRNGQRFINMLSIIPIAIDGSGYRYALGLQVELD